MEEIEVKFLEIDHAELQAKLVSLGAEKTGEYFYKVKAYDYSDKRLGKENAWVRLRGDGTQVNLCYKQRQGVSADRLRDQGMKEIEVMVDNFEKADQFLASVGLIEKFVEDKRRIRYMFEGVEIDLDEVPLLPPYLELEGPSWEDLERVALMLGLDWAKHLRCSSMQVYEHYGLDENDYSVLTFKEQVKKAL
mgnify:CR=1 FL=1|jgi:adenylate cyclase class 2